MVPKVGNASTNSRPEIQNPLRGDSVSCKMGRDIAHLVLGEVLGSFARCADVVRVHRCVFFREFIEFRTVHMLTITFLHRVEKPDARHACQSPALP